MKSSGQLLIVFGIIFALMIGLFIGLSLKIGNVNQSGIAGTLTKINNFKKAQSSITGVEIEDQLLRDTVRLKNMQNYLRFYYATSAKMAGDIRFSIDEANSAEAFKNKYSKELADLVSYEKSFAMARIDLLIALRGCLNPDKTNPLLLGEFINQASNVIARMNFGNRVVLDFIDIVDSYIKENKSVNLPGLTRAHDLLMYNELNTGLMTRDKLVLKSFNNKVFLVNVKDQKFVDSKGLTDLMKKDLEQLASMDAEIPALKSVGKLDLYDLEKLGLQDVEKLGLLDQEKFGAWDSETLGNSFKESERLGQLLLFPN